MCWKSLSQASAVSHSMQLSLVSKYLSAWQAFVVCVALALTRLFFPQLQRNHSARFVNSANQAHLLSICAQLIQHPFIAEPPADSRLFCCDAVHAPSTPRWTILSQLNGCECCLQHTSGISECFLEGEACGTDFCNCNNANPSCLVGTRGHAHSCTFVLLSAGKPE